MASDEDLYRVKEKYQEELLA